MSYPDWEVLSTECELFKKWNRIIFFEELECKAEKWDADKRESKPKRMADCYLVKLEIAEKTKQNF